MISSLPGATSRAEPPPESRATTRSSAAGLLDEGKHLLCRQGRRLRREWDDRPRRRERVDCVVEAASAGWAWSYLVTARPPLMRSLRAEIRRRWTLAYGGLAGGGDEDAAVATQVVGVTSAAGSRGSGVGDGQGFVAGAGGCFGRRRRDRRHRGRRRGRRGLGGGRTDVGSEDGLCRSGSFSFRPRFSGKNLI